MRTRRSSILTTRILAVIILGVLGLSWPTEAQSTGILASYNPREACFLIDGEKQCFGITRQQFATLSRTGLGSSWEVYPSGDSLASCLPRGTDRSIVEALDTLERFARAIDRRDWRLAQSMLSDEDRHKNDLPGFERKWSLWPISTEEIDWALIAVTSDRIDVRIVKIAMEADDRFQDFHIYGFHLLKVDNSWKILQGPSSFRQVWSPSKETPGFMGHRVLFASIRPSSVSGDLPRASSQYLHSFAKKSHSS